MSDDHQTKRMIHLHGKLAAFGGPYSMAVDTAAEAARSLFQIPGFRQALAEGEYRVVAWSRDLDQGELRLGLGKWNRVDFIPVAAGAKRGGIGKAIIGAVILTAAIYTGGAAFAAAGGAGGAGAAGAGAAAAGSAAAGATGASWATGTALSFGGFTVSYGQVALFGASTLLGGLAQMFTSVPSVGDFGQFEAPDSRESFLFSGAVNTTEQGGAVPLVFGRALVGSKVISAGLVAERV